MLSLSQITSGYGRLDIIRNLDLELVPGQFVGLFGRNGAGKSTLASTIMGIIKPKAGEIALDGDSLLGLRTEERVRRGVSLVPQSRGLFMGLTVKENIDLACVTLKVPADELRRREEEAYERFPVLYERRHLAAASLSGGEQQMLGLAKALMRKPRVLILDEPSMGLAPMVLDRIAELVNELRGSELTVLITEQNIRWTLGMIDIGYVLDQGTIVERFDAHAGEMIEIERIMGRYLGSGGDGAAKPTGGRG